MFLGIDLGEKTTGLAISSGEIASPYKTITHKNLNQIQSLIIQIIELEEVDTVVVGFVEGKIKKMFTKFSQSLQKAKPHLKVILWDETLTSRQASDFMIKLGIAKKKRKEKEHEIAASLILQSYLDSK